MVKGRAEPVKPIENVEKKQLFQRFWSEADEIIILKGMIDYASQKNVEPIADLNAFYEVIKKDIHVDFTRKQLQAKIRKLRKKFVNNKSKEKNGKNRTFSKTHEQEAYESSKRIWNGAGEFVVVAMANVAKGKDVLTFEVSKNRNVNLAAGGGTIEERIMKIGSEAFEGGRAGEKAMLWNNLQRKEIEAYTTQLEVKKAQTHLVLNFLKS